MIFNIDIEKAKSEIREYATGLTRPLKTARVILNSSGNSIRRKHSYAMRHWQISKAFQESFIMKDLRNAREMLSIRMLGEIEKLKP